MTKLLKLALALTLAAALFAASCGDSEPSSNDPAAPQELTKVTLQLQWLTQSQFAGYYAALDQGFYEDQGLDVDILEGSVEIVPITVLESGQADFAVSWVPRGLVPREEGAGRDQHRPDLPAQRHAAGVLCRLRHRVGG